MAPTAPPPSERELTQIIWSFDTTGSMTRCLSEVRSSISELCDDLGKRLGPKKDSKEDSKEDANEDSKKDSTLEKDQLPSFLEMGIIAHGDYCDEQRSYLIKHRDFTRDVGELKRFVHVRGHYH